MKTPNITLGEARKSSKLGTEHVHSVSEFISSEDLEKLHRTHKKRQRKFDDVDAIIAEIIARFGYDVYERWNDGEIDNDFMGRMINAERAREAAARSEIETVIFATITGVMNKKGLASLRQVQNIIKNNVDNYR